MTKSPIEWQWIIQRRDTICSLHHQPANTKGSGWKSIAWTQNSPHICSSRPSLVWSPPKVAAPVASQCSMNWPSRGILVSHLGHLPLGKSGQAPTKANQNASRPHVQCCEFTGRSTTQHWISSTSCDQQWESAGLKSRDNGRNGIGISTWS